MREAVRCRTPGRTPRNLSNQLIYEFQEEQKGVPLTQERIEDFLDDLAAKGRVQGTIEGYRRGLNRLYQELPDNDKFIRRNTLRLWREKLVQDGYSVSAVNSFIVMANGYLEFAGAREYQITDKLKAPKQLLPELTRGEYLRLLSTARALGRERVYLLVKVFGNSDLPVQELEHLTVEVARAGTLSITYNYSKEIIRFPESVCRELLAYAQRKGIRSGPIFLTREGTPMSRTNVTTGIRQLCAAAQVPEEKGSPRCLRKLYQTTREGIERNISLLVEQAQNRLLEEEQLTVGWEETP